MLEICLTGLQIEARRWFFNTFDAKSYSEMNEKYPRRSDDRDRLFNVLGFYESAGALVSRKLLHEDVFFDAPFGLVLVWARVGPILAEWQQAANDPAVWEKVEWLGRRYEWWRAHAWKPKLQAFPPRPARRAKRG